MYSIPIEIQLDVLKCLDFDQLFSFKQTNFYFRNLVNKYENGLARMNFYQLDIATCQIYIQSALRSEAYKIVKPESLTFEFTLTDRLLKKWKMAINESIPLFLHNSESVGNGNLYVWLEKTVNKKQSNYILEFPTIPKNLEEMIISRCWLEQLLKCTFERAWFEKIIFNPQMINLLFDDNNKIPIKFNIQKPTLSPDNNLFENFLEFSLNYLTISDFLNIDFYEVNNLEQHVDIFFNLLISEGNKLSKVRLCNFTLTSLHDLITKHIATSKNCSEMVSTITLDCPLFTNFKLDERAENVKIEISNKIKRTTYQISNIYNPEVKFQFYIIEMEDGSIFNIYIFRTDLLTEQK
uniref:F-box domain-containing protein n=1 Tax=Meloidogyne enterolobii TaxID=390850 RepID=A0A6V7UEL4_MELEN|nr:unnamed protein product [Meloidogyne enterolobii]